MEKLVDWLVDNDQAFFGLSATCFLDLCHQRCCWYLDWVLFFCFPTAWSCSQRWLLRIVTAQVYSSLIGVLNVLSLPPGRNANYTSNCSAVLLHNIVHWLSVCTGYTCMCSRTLKCKLPRWGWSQYYVSQSCNTRHFNLHVVQPAEFAKHNYRHSRAQAQKQESIMRAWVSMHSGIIIRRLPSLCYNWCVGCGHSDRVHALAYAHSTLCTCTSCVCVDSTACWCMMILCSAALCIWWKGVLETQPLP